MFDFDPRLLILPGTKLRAAVVDKADTFEAAVGSSAAEQAKTASKKPL